MHRKSHRGIMWGLSLVYVRIYVCLILYQIIITFKELDAVGEKSLYRRIYTHTYEKDAYAMCMLLLKKNEYVSVYAA